MASGAIGAPFSSLSTKLGEVPSNHNSRKGAIEEVMPPIQKSLERPHTRGSSLVAKAAEETCRVLRDGGVWFIVTAKAPWLMLEAMNVTTWADLANVDCVGEALIASDSGRRVVYHNRADVQGLEFSNSRGGLQSFADASRLQIDHATYTSGVYVIKLLKICKGGCEC